MHWTKSLKIVEKMEKPKRQCDRWLFIIIFSFAFYFFFFYFWLGRFLFRTTKPFETALRTQWIFGIDDGWRWWSCWRHHVCVHCSKRANMFIVFWVFFNISIFCASFKCNFFFFSFSSSSSLIHLLLLHVGHLVRVFAITSIVRRINGRSLLCWHRRKDVVRSSFNHCHDVTL